MQHPSVLAHLVVMSRFHNMTVTSDDKDRTIFTGILYPNVMEGSGPAHRTIQTDPNDRRAYYNDPAVRVNEQDLEDWNYLRGEDIWFEHGQHQKKPAKLGKWIDCTVNKNRDLYVVGEIRKKNPDGTPNHEGVWASQKLLAGEIPELSIGYQVVPFYGTNRVKCKRFEEGSLVLNGYLPRTKIAVACSNAGVNKSSAGGPDLSQVGYRITLMASNNPTPDAPTAGTSTPAPTEHAAPASSAQVSGPGGQKATPHHSSAQPRSSDGRFSKEQAAPVPSGEPKQTADDIASANQLELETRFKAQQAAKEAEIAKLKEKAALADQERDELNAFRKAKEEALQKEREEAVKKMDEAFAAVKKTTGLSDEELSVMQAGYRNVAARSIQDQDAIKASGAFMTLSGKVNEMGSKLSQQEATLAEKEKMIAELQAKVQAAQSGRNIMASRVNQARANLRNANLQSAAKTDDKGKEEEDEGPAENVQASRGLHGSHIGDLLLPLPSVQYDSWEAQYVNEANESFGARSGGAYGVHASAGPDGRAPNPYDGRTYRPVGDHKFSWYTGHGMKNQSPPWWAHVIAHNDRITNLPMSNKIKNFGEFNSVEKEAMYTFGGPQRQ